MDYLPKQPVSPISGVSRNESKLQKFLRVFKEKKLWWKVPLLILVSYFLFLAGSLAYKVIIAAKNILVENLSGKAPAFLGKVQPKELKGEGDGRINILVIGIPGGNYPGATLADTIILVSVDPKNKKVGMVSIPRDLWVKIPGYGYAKINAAHAYGEENVKKQPGGGPALLKQTVSSIIDLPIHYFVRVNFEGFKKIIDLLGGVEVVVDKDIHDYEYPNEKGGYSPFHLKAGTYTMNGELALKYARSRKSTSDFDRARRQQQILVAVKNKAMRMENLLNPAKISELLGVLKNNFKTDLELWEIERLIGLAKEVNSENVVSRVIDSSQTHLLYSANVNGQSVLKPVGDNFTKIAAFAHEVLPDPYLVEENARIAIKNGTTRSGIATSLKDFLKSYGYNVVEVGLADRKDYKKTIIYDNTGGKKPYTINFLAKRLNVEVQKGKLDQNFDIVILLGKDYKAPIIQ